MGGQVAREAVRAAKSGNRSRQHGNAAGIRTFAQPFRKLLLVVVGGLLTFIPVLELKNECRCIGLDVTAERVKTHHGNDVLYAVERLNLL